MKRLLDRLELEVRLLDSLRVATEEERLALASGDMERIAECTDRKRGILQAYESIGITRDDMLTRQPGGRDVVDGTTTLREHVTHNAPPEIRDSLYAAIDQIQKIGARLQRLNAVNTLLLQRTLDWTLRARAALAGETSAVPLYTRHGHVLAARVGSSIVTEQA